MGVLLLDHEQQIHPGDWRHHLRILYLKQIELPLRESNLGVASAGGGQGIDLRSAGAAIFVEIHTTLKIKRWHSRASTITHLLRIDTRCGILVGWVAVQWAG